MDLITYINDITQLRLDIAQIANEELDHENPHLAHAICCVNDESAMLLLTKIPTVKNGNSSVSLVRGVAECVLDAIPSIEIIGHKEGDELIFKTGGRDKYESVYDVTERTYIDDDDVTQTYKPPYCFGGFA